MRIKEEMKGMVGLKKKERRIKMEGEFKMEK